MPVPDNPLICKVALIYSRDTREFINTFHVYKSTGWTSADMLAVAIQFSNWWRDFLRIRVPAAVALVREEVRLLDPDNPLAVDRSEPVPLPGTLAQEPSPGNASLAVGWRTPYAGRAYRGRFFVPSLGEGDALPNDTIGSFALFAFSAAAQALLDSLSGTSTPLAIFHRNDNLFSIITAWTVDLLIDSMKRRLAGRGI